MLEYAEANSPDNWNLIAPPSSVPVLDGYLPRGSRHREHFLCEAHGMDRAGNSAANRKRYHGDFYPVLRTSIRTVKYSLPMVMR